jgi:hypothetical protein
MSEEELSRKKSAKKYYEAHKEKLRLWQREYYHRNKEIISEKLRKNYAEKGTYYASQRELGQKWRAKNGDRYRAFQRAYYAQNRDMILAKKKAKRDKERSEKCSKE